MNRASANLLLLVTGAIWGGGFVAQSVAMDTIGPVFFTGIRFAAAALIHFSLPSLRKKIMNGTDRIRLIP